MSKWFLVAVMSVAAFGESAVTAGHCSPPCYYKTVMKHVPQRVAYRVHVVAYKPCGTPYYTWQTAYKTVLVPVYYQVKVCP